MAQNWQIDPDQKDYVMDKGAPVQTDSLEIPAYVRMRTGRGEWLYAPDKTFGFDKSVLTKRVTNGKTGTIESAASAAVQPIADDGRAAFIEVTATESNRPSVGMNVRVTAASGKIDQLNLKSLGG